MSSKYDPNELPWNVGVWTSNSGPGNTWHAALLIPSDAPPDDYVLSTVCTSTATHSIDIAVTVTVT